MLLLVFALLPAVVLPGCDRRDYAQSTPEEVIASAQQMIVDGQAERLSELLYAEDDRVRRLTDHLGVVLGQLQDLTQAIAEQYPEDVQRIKAKLESGEVPARLSGAFTGRRSGTPRAPDGNPDGGQIAQDLFRELLADPFAWIRTNADRVTTQPITDDMVAVLWDEQPIMPPIGLAMIERDGQWAVMLPTSLPMVNRFLPQTDAQERIFHSFMKAFEHALSELERDVRAGRPRDLDHVAELAGEKLFLPAAMIGIAYGKAKSEERDADNEDS